MCVLGLSMGFRGFQGPQAIPGVFHRVSGAFQRVSEGFIGVLWGFTGVSGCFRSVPGFKGFHERFMGLKRHPRDLRAAVFHGFSRGFRGVLRLPQGV